MQLKPPGNSSIASVLGVLTASLLGASGASAGTLDSTLESVFQLDPERPSVNDDTSTDEGKIRLDAAVLVYQEDGGRVKAIEPMFGATINRDDGKVISVHLVADTLTGATPNGATPWSSAQEFVSPVMVQVGESTTTVTRTSGGSKVTIVPGPMGIGASYTETPANTLPLDYGFKDTRYAGDVSLLTPISEKTVFSFGGGLSVEQDYSSYYGNASLSHTFNQKNTTAFVTLNYEHDLSSPEFGTPTPLTAMNGSLKNGDGSKDTYGVMVGVSQVMTRNWLAQLNVNFSQTEGYQTDPYRVISVVYSTGGPAGYLYEGRPESRARGSIYFGNKVAVGPTVADLSARLYSDDWGINSLTLEASDRFGVSRDVYLEPGVRYYSQTAADFFHDYLPQGHAAPDYASSDSRLSDFSAVTASLKAGVRFGPGEAYAEVERYMQSGGSNYSNAPGYLSGRDLFSGVDATSVIFGYSLAFR